LKLVAVMVELPEEPAPKNKLFGEALMPKSGPLDGGVPRLTYRKIFCDSLPLLAYTLMLEEPWEKEVGAETVSIDVAVPPGGRVTFVELNT